MIGNRRAAPTSLPLCNTCDLPGSEYLCSSMSHPEITGIKTMGGIVARRPIGAICNDGKPEITDISGCHAGGHECWKQTIQVADSVDAPRSAPSDLPDALDTLEGFWRLAFGKNHELIVIHRIASTATLLVDCTTRAEFESRVCALHVVLDKMKIDDELLPEDTQADKKNGSMNRLETCLKDRLPEQQYPAIMKAIRMLRQVRRVRVALQHTGGNNDLSTALSGLGITDAPPNWGSAWDRIRAGVADALNSIRRELGTWIDSQRS
jgi:hypothetical protein